MIFYTSPAMLAVFIAIIGLQIASALLKGTVAKILSFVNIALHIALIPAALIAGADFSELAMLFMASLAVLMLTSFIKHKLTEKKQNSKSCDGEVHDDI